MTARTITCVVPTLNSAATLDYTLASLVNQSGVELRIVVVDSGSTDATLDICRRWGVESLYEPPGNMYAAINTGLATASTEWVAYVNSDDLLFAKSLERLIDHGRAATAAFVYGDADFIDADGRFLSSFSSARPAELLPLFRSHIMGLIQPSVIFTAAAYRQLNGFDTRYRLGADADFFLRALLAGIPFAYLPHATVTAFRLHGGQQTGRHLAAFLEELRHVFAVIPKASLADRLVLARWRARNAPNYLVRATRLALLGHGLRVPRFSSQL